MRIPWKMNNLGLQAEEHRNSFLEQLTLCVAFYALRNKELSLLNPSYAEKQRNCCPFSADRLGFRKIRLSLESFSAKSDILLPAKSPSGESLRENRPL